MREAAADLDFEEAARLRDEIKRLQAIELAIADDPLARQQAIEEQAGAYRGERKYGGAANLPASARTSRPTTTWVGLCGRGPEDSPRVHIFALAAKSPGLRLDRSGLPADLRHGEFDRLQAFHFVAIARGLLEFEIGGGFAHALFEIGDRQLEIMAEHGTPRRDRHRR